MLKPTSVLNDNSACIQWSHNTTIKALRHIKICKNANRESTEVRFVSVYNVEGAINVADLFTKEEYSIEHFISLRNRIMYIIHQQ